MKKGGKGTGGKMARQHTKKSTQEQTNTKENELAHFAHIAEKSPENKNKNKNKNKRAQ